MDLVPFTFEGAQVRAFPIDGDPWFVGKDVAGALGYSNPQKALRDHCKAAQPIGVNDPFTPSQVGAEGGLALFPPLDPQTIIIPERDVYRLIMRSKLPSAERFEEMVVGEILPSIRKTGAFGAAPHVSHPPREVRLQFKMGLAIAKALGLRDNQAVLSANGLTRRATGFDVLAAMGQRHLVAPQPEALLTPTDIGHEIGGVSAIRVNELLQEYGFQIGQRDSKGRPYWEPTKKGLAAGAVMLDVERGNKTGTARQLRWSSGIVEVLRDLIEAA